MNISSRTATASHTPGPWEVIYSKLERRAGAVLRIEAQYEKGTTGGTTSIVYQNGIGRPASEIGRANARLIAAAPELLAVLRKLEWKSTDKDNMEFRCDTNCYVLDEIRAAIAKATGAAS